MPPRRTPSHNPNGPIRGISKSFSINSNGILTNIISGNLADRQLTVQGVQTFINMNRDTRDLTILWTTEIRNSRPPRLVEDCGDAPVVFPFGNLLAGES